MREKKEEYAKKIIENFDDLFVKKTFAELYDPTTAYWIDESSLHVYEVKTVSIDDNAIELEILIHLTGGYPDDELNEDDFIMNSAEHVFIVRGRESTWDRVNSVRFHDVEYVNEF